MVRRAYINAAIVKAAATILGWFVPSTSPQINLIRILIVGIAITSFFLFAGNYFVPGGANHFTIWAEALTSGQKLVPHYAQRDVGYPLLLLLSGYTLTGSFIGITLIQSAFAILMPALIFRALQEFSNSIAYYAGQISNLSLAPILYMKMIHHDQLYIFSTIMMIVALIFFVVRLSYKYLYLFTGLAITASISRPAGNLLFPVLLLTAWIFDRRTVKHYVACLAIFIMSMSAYQWHRTTIFDIKSQQSFPSYTGQQVFYNVYINSRDYGITLSPLLGPNMKRLGDTLKAKLGPELSHSRFFQGQIAAADPHVAKTHFLPYLCVPKIRFCNIGGEGRRERVVM